MREVEHFERAQRRAQGEDEKKDGERRKMKKNLDGL